MSAEVARIPSEEKDNVLKSFEFRGRSAQGLITSGNLSKPANIFIKLAASEAASKAPGSDTLASGLFWYNGVEWGYLGGENNLGNLTVQAAHYGHYQLRAVVRSTEE